MDVTESNVIDVFEEYIETVGWDYARTGDNSITFARVGEWKKYQFVLSETSGLSCVLLIGYFTLNIKKKRLIKSLPRLYELLNVMHEDMPLGVWSHSMASDGVTSIIRWSYQWYFSEDMALDDERIDKLLDAALLELDEFYPAIQLVLATKCAVRTAYSKAIPPAYGRA